MSDVNKNIRQNTKFVIEIDGISVGSFEDCEISPASFAVVKNRTGTDGDTFTVSQGLKDPQTIKIGKISRAEDNAAIGLFSDWYAAGDRDKRGGRIDYVDQNTGETYHRETFENALCNEFAPPKLDAKSPADARFQATITAPKVTPVAV
ncbi:phage tail protein [Candidatus Pacearchaeota archaeon]|jgi:hypothetical protein|nr:phage tail protein [Candidatus Pacearchaeota archaeon]